MKRILVFTLVSVLLLSSSVSGDSGDYLRMEWNYTVKEFLSGLAVEDLDGDGFSEVVASSSSEGGVYALDYKGGMSWGTNLQTYLFFVYASDLDSDNRSEVITGSGRGIYVLDGGSGNVTLRYSTQDNDVKYAVAADLNADRKKEVIFSAYSYDSCTGNYIYAINKSGFLLTGKSYAFRYEYPNVIYAADLDGDGADEILVGTVFRSVSTVQKMCLPAYNRPGHVYLLDIEDNEFKMKWVFEAEGGITYVSVLNDSIGREVIVGSYPNLYALNLNGTQLWNYTTVSFVADAFTKDLDADGRSEIIIGSDEIHVLDRDGTLKWSARTDSRVYSLYVEDVDLDHESEVVAGADRIYVFGSDGTLKWKSPYYRSVEYVKVRDLDGDGYNEVVAGALKQAYVYRTGIYAKKNEADSYYNTAMVLYSRGDYTNASQYASKARDIYSELGFQNDLKEAFRLSSMIENKTREIWSLQEQAYLFYSKAKDSYLKGDYMNASIHAQKSQGIYSSLNYAGNVSRDDVERLINNSNEYLRLNADREYNTALAGMNSSDYDNALVHAGNAQKIYEFLGEKTRALECGRLASEADSRRKEASSKTRGIVYLAAALILLLLGVVLFFKYLRKKAHGDVGVKESVPKETAEETVAGGGVKTKSGKAVHYKHRIEDELTGCKWSKKIMKCSYRGIGRRITSK